MNLSPIHLASLPPSTGSNAHNASTLETELEAAASFQADTAEDGSVTYLHPNQPWLSPSNTLNVTGTTSTLIESQSSSTSTSTDGIASTAATTPPLLQPTSPTLPSDPPQHHDPTPISPPQATYTHSNNDLHSTHRSRASILQYWLKPILAFVIYSLTLGVAFSASARYTLLGSVRPSVGTWFLNLLAKSGDLAFAFAVEDAFDSLAWGKLKKRARLSGHGSFGGMELDWFLSWVSSTGVVGLTLLLWRKLAMSWRGRSGWRRWDWQNITLVRERWKRWRTVRWSFARLVFLVVLIPGPGIILMADINQKDLFFETRGMTVTGGLGIYSPELATQFRTTVGPDISRLAQMMLRDPSISWPVESADPVCKASKACASYLFAGPYRTVQPWPFTVETDDLDGFLIHNAPFYQVDMWTVEHESELVFNETQECNLYGGFDPKQEYSIKVCMRQHVDDTLVAGWKSCNSGYDNTTSQCLNATSLPGGKHGWTTYLHFFRRKATVTFSRTQFTILDVRNLSSAKSQTITAASLFTATNAMLYRPNLSTNDIRYDRNSQPYMLTQVIGSSLWLSTQERMQGLPIGKDWLRNILTLPVYLFQPTVIATAENLPVNYQENGTTPLLNLPDENYVEGSYCIVDKRAIPGIETVIGYACVAGHLLLFVLLAKLLASRWPAAETSEFPLLNYEVLTRLVDDRGNPVVFRDRYALSGKEYDTQGVLEEIGDMRVGLCA